MQTFQTDWVDSSTQSSLVTQNSYFIYYPVSCQSFTNSNELCHNKIRYGNSRASPVKVFFGELSIILKTSSQFEIFLELILSDSFDAELKPDSLDD